MTAADLLRSYAGKCAGHFTRQQFLTWAAHHGLSRRTPPQVIDQAIAELIAAGALVQVSTPPGSLLPIYRGQVSP